MMKKLVKSLFFTFLAYLTTSSGFAQSTFTQDKHESDKWHDHKGRFFAGGAVSFWTDHKDKTLTLDICPEVGYLFNDSWGVGMLLGYEYERRKTGETKTIGNAFKITPFVRYYYFHRSPFNLYLDAGGGFNFSKVKESGITEHLNGYEVGIRPGACIDLTEGLCLCLRMGFVGYRNDFFMGEEPKIGTKGFGFRFVPEELMVGLELEF